VAQLIRIERTWRELGKQKQQVRYAITSLPPSIGTAQKLLALKRQHWLIENRSHRAKDVNLGEDASLIHCRQGPAVCSVLRNIALSLLRRAGYHAIAARLRYYSQCPAEAVLLLLDSPTAHA
jgi:predicted transposase YbfD/YdcC